MSRCLLSFCVAVWVISGTGLVALAQTPASVEQAAKVLHLAHVPLFVESEKPNRQTLAGLSYRAKGTVAEVSQFHKAELARRMFKELPGGHTTEQYASSTFQRDDFTLSLSVSDAGMPGWVLVVLTNHGNIRFDQLPLPTGSKPLFTSAVMASVVSDLDVAAAQAASRKLLLEAGWQPYGTAGGSQYFRQNAIKLAVMASQAPAQGNKTVLMYSAELMSAELPLIPNATRADYSDLPTQLSFDSAADKRQVEQFYRGELAAGGWKATTEQPIKSGLAEEVIFRNGVNDLLQLKLSTVAGQTRGMLKYQTAAEVAAAEKAFDEKFKERQAQAALDNRTSAAGDDTGPMPVAGNAMKQSVLISPDAEQVKVAPHEIKFTVGNGKAKEIVQELANQLKAAGWSAKAETLQGPAGTVVLLKKQGTISIVFTDTGFLPAEVTILGVGVELEPAK